MMKWPLPADFVITVFVVVTSTEIMCDVGEAHGECNCYVKCLQQEAHYSALT